MSVISNVDNIRRRLQRAMKEIGLLNSQDIDRVVEDSLDEEGEEMVRQRQERKYPDANWSIEPRLSTNVSRRSKQPMWSIERR